MSEIYLFVLCVYYNSEYTHEYSVISLRTKFILIHNSVRVEKVFKYQYLSDIQI